MYRRCAAPKKGIKNTARNPDGVTQENRFLTQVTQNGKLRHFKQCQKVRKIPVFVVNTWYFYGTLHQKRYFVFCVIEGSFSFINQESRDDSWVISFLPEICHNTVSQRATTYDDNVVFTFKDRKEVTI